MIDECLKGWSVDLVFPTFFMLQVVGKKKFPFEVDISFQLYTVSKLAFQTRDDSVKNDVKITFGSV